MYVNMSFNRISESKKEPKIYACRMFGKHKG